jgi:creatinine amidohydrolase/Fe(II)-dependent formamide hydrolase-like protein
MLIWILVPVLIIVSVHGGNLVALVEGGRQVEARFSAIEIASALSVLQSGPDGVEHTYDMPAITQPGCVKIYQTYVETSLGYTKGRQGASELVERAAFSADIHREGLREGEPIVIDCAPGAQLVLKKEVGKVSVTRI